MIPSLLKLGNTITNVSAKILKVFLRLLAIHVNIS
jgi:hypothetical protein